MWLLFMRSHLIIIELSKTFSELDYIETCRVQEIELNADKEL